MTTIIAITVPAALLTLLLEVRDGRVDALAAGLDGGIAIGLGALGLRLAGIL